MTETQYGCGFLSRLESLEQRNALVIGGHGELGYAIASALADRGANVVLASRKLDRCRVVAERIQDEFDVKSVAMECDISNESSVRQTIDEMVGQLGSIDILVNNAGTSWSGAPEEIPLSGWNKILEVNLTGSFVAARTAAKHMLARGEGSIIFIASTGGLTSFTPDLAEIVPYTTSKAGVIHLTRDLAAQWANKGIRVNAIAPGQMRSGLTLSISEEAVQKMTNSVPMKRLGDPLEIAGMVALLASNAASYITGQTMIIDGGLTLR